MDLDSRLMFVEHQSTSDANIDRCKMLHKSGIALFFDQIITVSLVDKPAINWVKYFNQDRIITI